MFCPITSLKFREAHESLQAAGQNRRSGNQSSVGILAFVTFVSPPLFPLLLGFILYYLLFEKFFNFILRV